MSNYQAFETLREHKARLHGSVLLGTGVELAAWSNCNDRVTQESADHHTLSLYVADGYECYQHGPTGGQRAICLCTSASARSRQLADHVSIHCAASSAARC